MIRIFSCAKNASLFNYILLALMLLFLQSCARHVNVTIDSISSSRALEKTRFVLLPGNENLSSKDLQYKEFEKYIESALIDVGFIKALDVDDADVAILFSYGISDPVTYNYSYTVPVWGQTGVDTNTSGNIYSFGNSSNFNTRTTSTPTYGIVGSTEKVGVGVLFARHYYLSAIDLEEYKKSNEVNDLWTTHVTSIGDSGDLRKIFPILVVASKKYIASNTGKKIDVTISENDKSIIELTSK